MARQPQATEAVPSPRVDSSALFSKARETIDSLIGPALNAQGLQLVDSGVKIVTEPHAWPININWPFRIDVYRLFLVPYGERTYLVACGVTFKNGLPEKLNLNVTGVVEPEDLFYDTKRAKEQGFAFNWEVKQQPYRSPPWQFDDLLYAAKKQMELQVLQNLNNFVAAH